MSLVVNIKCPHCQVQGRMLLPNPNTILVGPCPVCHELVLVFAGVTFPMDTKTFEALSLPAKKEYLEAILRDFVDESLQRLFAFSEKEASSDMLPSGAYDDTSEAPEQGYPKPERITDSEMEHFVSEDLRALDNPQYFKKIFG